MAEQPIISPAITRNDELVATAKEFVQLWLDASSVLLPGDPKKYTLESLISYLHNGLHSNLQKVPDLAKITNDVHKKRDELKKKQDSLREKLKNITTEVDYITSDAREAEDVANVKCTEIEQKIAVIKSNYEEKLREEHQKQQEEVRKKTAHLHKAQKFEFIRIIEQHQAQITEEEKEWQKLVQNSESERRWHSLDEFIIKEQPMIESAIGEYNYTKLDLISTESEEIIEERMTEEPSVPVQASIKSISVKNKATGQLVAAICINVSELISLKLDGFRKIATELPVHAKFLFKGAPISLRQEEIYKLIVVLEGDNLWIKICCQQIN